MSKELKTLKDIDSFQVEQITKYISILQKADCFKPKEKREVIAWLTHQMKLFDLIKQEAIKRIKYWKKYPESASVGELVNEMQIFGRIAELKDFCNITEEDLQ